MDFCSIGYPCIVGHMVGVCKVTNINELKHYFHFVNLDNRAFLKEGFNEKLRIRFLITGDGAFREFIPLIEKRKWARAIPWLVESKLECEVKVSTHFSRGELSLLIKRNLTSLDRHFPRAMKLYKLLKQGEQNLPLSQEQVSEIIKNV